MSNKTPTAPFKGPAPNEKLVHEPKVTGEVTHETSATNQPHDDAPSNLSNIQPTTTSDPSPYVPPQPRERMFAQTDNDPMPEPNRVKGVRTNVDNPTSVRAARPVGGVAPQPATRDGKDLPQNAKVHISQLAPGYKGAVDPISGELVTDEYRDQ